MNMDFAGKNSIEPSLKSDFSPLIKSIFNVNTAQEKESLRPDYCEVSDFGRESLGIINLDKLDVGRESLGISNIKTSDIFGTCLPEIQITDFTQNSNTTSLFNNAMLLSSAKSITSSTSSINSVFSSFNSASLDSNILSRISSTSSCKTDVCLNDGFIDSSEFFKRFQMCEKSALSSLKLRSEHHRIKSLPSNLEDERNTLEKKRRKTEFSSDDFFSDSVFIEANHLAARIENGSILELGSNENDMLDLIQEPEDLVELSDKKIECEEPCQTVKLVSDKNSALKQEEFDNSVDNKSRDTKGILNTLSDILTKDSVISKKQKSDCQNMISNLVEILVTSDGKVNNLDDSGNSSVDNDPEEMHQKPEVYEVLDLSIKTLDTSMNFNESNENCGPLDLSLKSKSAQSETSFKLTALKSKFNISQPTKSVFQGNTSLRNNSSISSNENRSFNELTSKFKLKKVEDKPSLKKGPLKATLAVNTMTKKKNDSKLQKTPQKNQSQLNVKMKKTSTPVNDVLLKPVAQSTPEFSYSPVKKPTSSSNDSLKDMKPRLNYSGSNAGVVQDQSLQGRPSLIRRRSAEHMKSNNQQNRGKLNRSFSVEHGGQSKLATIANSAKEGLNKSTSGVKHYKSTVGLKDNTSKIVNRPLGKKN